MNPQAHRTVPAVDRAKLDNVRWDNSGVFKVTRAIAIAFAIAAPLCALTLTDMPLFARLWAAFLLANVGVWVGVVAVLASRVLRERGAELRHEVRRARENTASRLAA